jgi:5-methylcytosine-specific restriction endonuclease McrA
MPKRLEINPGDTFPNKHWEVIREVDKKGKHRHFLCLCLLCNREYEVALNSLRRKNGWYCCNSCAISKYHEIKADELIGQKFNRLLVLEKHSQDTHGRWRYLCQCDCLTISIVTGSQLTNGGIKSCGCLKIERSSELNSGENNRNWKGGISPKNKLDRTKLKQINRIIRERDNYTCQNCNQHKGWLNVHHIFDFATYEELRFEESNLITLCKRCHDNFHSIYPTSLTNTLFDLENWLVHEYKYRQTLLNYYEYYYC